MFTIAGGILIAVAVIILWPLVWRLAITLLMLGVVGIAALLFFN